MRWRVKPLPDTATTAFLKQVLNVDSLTSVLLAQRGITSFDQAREFFRPGMHQLHNPWLMAGMQEAVARIEQAMEEGEYILVFGDYDVDGTTSVALMSSWLRERYPHVATYIPDRYAEGYGVSYQGIDFAADNNITLIIALDCGVKAVDKVAYAKEKGIDFIICDHHTPGTSLPDAVAVLDPKRPDCAYPYKELCGCGVGFKLIQALHEREGGKTEDLIPWLDLVATAIAADIVPLTGENRTLAFLGLKVINGQPRPGIQALKGKDRTLTLNQVVFRIAPRINAAGRMKHGIHAVELLCETNLDTAIAFAEEIETFNSDRKQEDKTITREAIMQIHELKEEDRCTTVVYQEHWHKGVIGIVASRLTETFYRPTLVFTKSGEKLAASARSVKDFDLYAALQECEDFLEQFGGHKYAAGLTLSEAQYPLFKERFETVVASRITPEMKEPELRIDAVVHLSDFTERFYRILKQFEPFGPENDAPLFLAKGVMPEGTPRTVGADNKHLKFRVNENGRYPMDAIGFSLGHLLGLLEQRVPVDIVFSLDENTWNGNTTLQLVVKDLKASD